MSGIAGIIHFDGAPAAAGLVEAMTSAMSHRGPDGIEHWVNGSVALGQCMLRTTPESLEERQPLVNEDETLVLVMDGRVDNWEDLRRELLGRGAVLRDRSDAELVLRAYEVWGRECLPHIDGDFALVIWDARRHEAFCARDRMGHKPFHYHWDGNTLSFASDLRAILALPWVKQEPNEGLLAEFLVWKFQSRDETLWGGILRLMAAHRMVATGREPQLECYWTPDLWAALPFFKDEEYVEHYRELLADIIRRLSRSHRPVSIDVSGGLDSSAIFCVAEHLCRSGQLLAPRMEGHTLAFTEEDGEAYELPYARAVGEHLGVHIHEILPARMPPSWFTEYARSSRDFPAYPNWAMNLGIHQHVVAQGSRVLLNGIGGDQWMEGSRAYYAEELAQRHWSTLLDCFKTDAKIFGVRQAMIWLIRQGGFPLLPSALRGGVRRLIQGLRGNLGLFPDDRFYWLSPQMQETAQLRLRGGNLQYGRQVGRFGQRRHLGVLDSAILRHCIEWAERLAAHSGIELRHPLNDPKIVQYAFSTPARLWLRGDRHKNLHIQALQGLMPKIVLERKNKAEFSVVMSEWLNQMREALPNRLSPEWDVRLSQDGMQQLCQSSQNDQTVKRYQWMWVLWTIHGCEGVYRQ